MTYAGPFEQHVLCGLDHLDTEDFLRRNFLLTEYEHHFQETSVEDVKEAVRETLGMFESPHSLPGVMRCHLEEEEEDSDCERTLARRIWSDWLDETYLENMVSGPASALGGRLR